MMTPATYLSNKDSYNLRSDFIGTVFPVDHIRGNIIAVPYHVGASGLGLLGSQFLVDTTPKRIDTVTAHLLDDASQPTTTHAKVIFRVGTLLRTIADPDAGETHLIARNDCGFRILHKYDPNNPEEGGFDPTQMLSGIPGVLVDTPVKDIIVGDNTIDVVLDWGYPLYHEIGISLTIYYQHEVFDAEGNIVTPKVRVDERGVETKDGSGTERYCMDDGSDGYYLLCSVGEDDTGDRSAMALYLFSRIVFQGSGLSLHCLCSASGLDKESASKSEERLSVLEAISDLSLREAPKLAKVTHFYDPACAWGDSGFMDPTYEQKTSDKNHYSQYNQGARYSFYADEVLRLYRRFWEWEQARRIFSDGKAFYADVSMTFIRGGPQIVAENVAAEMCFFDLEGNKVPLLSPRFGEGEGGYIAYAEGFYYPSIRRYGRTYSGWDFWRRDSTYPEVYHVTGGGNPPKNKKTYHVSADVGTPGMDDPLTPDSGSPVVETPYGVTRPYGGILVYSSWRSGYYPFYVESHIGAWHYDSAGDNVLFAETGEKALLVDALIEAATDNTMPVFNINYSTEPPDAKFYIPDFYPEFTRGAYAGAKIVSYSGRWRSQVSGSPSTTYYDYVYMGEVSMEVGPGEITISKSTPGDATSVFVYPTRLELGDAEIYPGETIGPQEGPPYQWYLRENYSSSNRDTHVPNSANLYADRLTTSVMGNPISDYAPMLPLFLVADVRDNYSGLYNRSNVLGRPTGLVNYPLAGNTSISGYSDACSFFFSRGEDVVLVSPYGDPVQVANSETERATVTLDEHRIVWHPLEQSHFVDTLFLDLGFTTLAIHVVLLPYTMLAKNYVDDVWNRIKGRINIWSGHFTSTEEESPLPGPYDYQAYPYNGLIFEKTGDVIRTLNDWHFKLCTPEVNTDRYSEERIFEISGLEEMEQRHRVFAATTYDSDCACLPDMENVIDAVRREDGVWELNLNEYESGTEFYLYVWEYATSACLRSIAYEALPPLGYDPYAQESQPPEPDPQTVSDGEGVNL